MKKLTTAYRDGSTPTIAIIGAGVSGLCVAIQLQRLLHITSYTIFDLDTEIGGTWSANIYPGASCDGRQEVKACTAYKVCDDSWSRPYAPQAEILEYLKATARTYNLYNKIKFQTRVVNMRWKDDRQKWVLHWRNEATGVEGDYEADIVYSCTGLLRVPLIPDEFREFKGDMWHSAQWNTSVNLSGKRVGVVGCSASGIQIIPIVARQVSHMTVYARTMPYILPWCNYRYSDAIKWAFRTSPTFLWLYTAFWYYLTDSNILLYYRLSWYSFIHRMVMYAVTWLYLFLFVRNKTLRKKMAPDYEIGSRRVVLTDDLFPALQRPNVDLRTEKIVKVEGHSIELEDGSKQELDVLILATGFGWVENYPYDTWFGKNGVDVSKSWGEDPLTYYGTTVPSSPNHFLIWGPNSGIGHNALTAIIEAQVEYSIQALSSMMEKDLGVIEVKEEAAKAFLDLKNRRFQNHIFTNCRRPKFLNSHGRVAGFWFGSCTEFWWHLRRFDLGVYKTEPRVVDVTENYYIIPQRNLISVQPLSTLKDTRLGIDGNAWVKKISISAGSEQYLAGIGGVAPKLRKAVEKELEGFKTHGIHPVFVFSGLSLMRKDKPVVNDGAKIAKRNVAWDAVNNGKLEQAQSSWSSSNFVHQSDLVHLILRILKEHGMNYMKAPYGAGAQLVYLERNPKQIVHSIYGSSELLMFDVDRVITSVDFEKGVFSVISKKALMQDLQLSDDQFLDLCILAGFDHFPTFPPLNMESGGFTIRNFVDLLRTHRTGFNAVKAFADSPGVVSSNYADLFMRTRCAMRYQPVLTTEGHIEPLNADQAPSDIHEFVGYRLPDEVYYYLSRGVISEFAFNVLLSGYSVEYSPLCNGETMEYRELLKTTVLGIKAQTLANLTAHLYSFYRDKKVSALYWFEFGTAAPDHPIKEDAAPVKVSEVANWKTGKSTIKGEATFASALATVATPAEAASTVRPPNAEKVALDSQTEIHGRHLLKLLQLRSFVDGKHELTSYGKALLAGNKVQANKTNFQSELFVALEMIRAGLLSNRPYSTTYTKTQAIQDAAIAKASCLISRTCSILNGRFEGTKPWTGPLNRDLLVFNSMHRSVSKNLRYLSEAVLLETLLANECNKEKVDYSELGTNTPFAYESSTVLGIIVQQYIEIVASNASFTPDQAVQQLSKQLGSVATSLFSHSLKEELARAFEFWQVVVAAAASLGETGAISKEAAKEFAEADAWLTKYRVRA
ncbi:hypothetical protein BGZ73_001685 [Actinomortierella ambigua]|nr:hypothetical protein BGZ73_001685 [Actinomortierella ambigua]